MKYVSILIMFFAMVTTGNPAYGVTADQIGIVKSMVGDVVIIRNNQDIKGEINLILMLSDTVKTGPNGKAGLILDDDTIISMGPNSKVVIKDFLFQPNEKKLSLIVKVIQGTISFLSGQISKLAPNVVHIELPFATVGLRGTHVLVKVD